MTESKRVNLDHGKALQFLGDRYSSVSELGTGGMGKVYKAHDDILDRWVAIKLIQPSLVSDELAVRFQREAKALSNLKHINLVSLLDFGLGSSNELFLVMEYVKGDSLASLLERKGKLKVAKALPIFLPLVGAMAHAHSKGIIHRDLKPSNVMIGENGIRVIDFGIAKELSEINNQKLTHTGAALGSPLYSSPEQIKGELVDERTDLYSLGCLFYECLTGKVPFLGNSVTETMQMHLNSLPAPMKWDCEDENQLEAFEKIIQKLLKKNPNDRYATMNDLRSDLNELIESCHATGVEIETNPKKAGVKSANKKVVVYLTIFLVLGGVTIAIPVINYKKIEHNAPDTVIVHASSKKKITTPFKRKGNTWFSYNLEGIGDEDIQWLKDKKPGNLKLSGLAITGETLGQLSHWEITKMDLDVCALTDRGLQEVSKLTSVTSLNLNYNKFTDSGLAHLSELPNIRRVSLQHCPLITSGGIEKLITGCPELTELKFDGNAFSPECLKKIAELKNLAVLNLADLNLDDNDLRIISKSKSLLDIDISKNKHISDKGIMLLAKIPNLRRLRINNCGFSEDNLNVFQSKMPNCKVIAEKKKIMLQGTRKDWKISLTSNFAMGNSVLTHK